VPKGMGGGARGACSVDSRGRGQASWGATVALPLSTVRRAASARGQP